MMSSRQLDEEMIFHTARLIDNSEARNRYLDQICAGDQALCERVEALLRVHEQEQQFLKSTPDELPPTIDQSPLAERPGSTIGRYRLMEQVGEGGMGVVFVAEQERPVRRKVALKIIKPGMDTKEVIARFEAERQALALMDHANIAKVLDAGSTDTGRPYFVMELVRGIPITEYCDQAKLSIRERLELFIQVCRAIQHAHQKGIIHRDVKPSNVLVTLHDGNPVPKVIDFGVAKATNQRLTERTIYTRLAQIIGTPMYMSPEQAELSGLDVDTRSDIYSLGVLLYELLTGTTPFDRERFANAAYDEIRRIVREEEPPKPSTKISSLGDTATTISLQRNTEPKKLHQTVRGDLDWIVMKAMEKDRTRRYETASGLAADIQRFLAYEPVWARAPSAAYRLRKYAWCNRTALGTIAVVILALVAATGISTWKWLDEIEARKRAEAIAQSLLSELLDKAFNASVNGEKEAALQCIQSAQDLGLGDDRADILRGIALYTAGDMTELLATLERLVGKGDDLACAVLVWVSYDAGMVGNVDQLSRQLAGPQEKLQHVAESDDIGKVFLARLWTYGPGDAHQDSIEDLSDVISRHRLWGFAYYARSEAYRDKFHGTRDLADLRAAMEDSQIARWLLPNSNTVNSSALELYLDAYHFAQASPDRVNDVQREEWRSHAEALAAEFAHRLSDWEGAAQALAFYRSTGQTTEADSLEAQIETKFADIQPIRDGMWFENRDLTRLEKELPTANSFTKHLYALALYERGETERALKVVQESLDQSKLNADALVSAVETLQLMKQFDASRNLAKDYLTSGTGWDCLELSIYVLKYFAGDLSEQELLEYAHPFHTSMCHMEHMVGVWHLARGDREAARKHLEASVATGRIGWGSYARAKAYLKRMDENPRWLDN